MLTGREKVVLSIGAHPDDAEFLCAGTLALLHEKGWDVQMATMTPGDCGTVEYSRAEISRIRKAEAAKAAAMLNGSYNCLECDDIFIMYDRPTLIKTVELVRKVRPTVVITTSPSDYMVDHEMASKLAQSACFCCGVVNVETPGAEPFEPVPYLYYMDAVDGKDKFGDAIEASMLVDITSAIEIKERMLCCHESQRNWLLAHHGTDNYVDTMKDLGHKNGKVIGCDYAEGFRQHLGHAYPQDNILKQELDSLVHVR